MIHEDYSERTVRNMSTKDLGIYYLWIKFGEGKRHIEKGGKDGINLKKTRDNVGSELGRRAREGEEAAKRYLNNRMSNQIDKYGKRIPYKPARPKKTLTQKIMRMLKGKMK